MILEIVSANPPPIKSDQRVLEWIRVHAEQGQTEAEVVATERAIADACMAYETQLTISQKCLQEDLKKIHKHHLQALANKREKAAREHASLKLDLRVECQQCAADLEADRLIGKQAKRCTQCPSPLTATKPKHKKTTSKVASRATLPVSELMDVDTDA
jgi:hypothetical protein